MTNKAKVEGSICNAYLVEEATSFCSYYFEDYVRRDIHKCHVIMTVVLKVMKAKNMKGTYQYSNIMDSYLERPSPDF